jgi:DUF4097 and DUF4098 domain-containing protein YvlB
METTFETPGRVEATVENMVGLVAVSTGDAATTHIALTADSPEAQELVDRAIVDCDERNGSYRVRVKVPKRHGPRFLRRNAVTVRISLPPAAELGVSTASANMELAGSFGDLKLTTASGDMDVDGQARDVEVSSASGSIVLGYCDGRMRGKSASGAFRVAECTGPVIVATTSGTLEVGAASAGVEMRCTSGDVHLGAVAGDVQVIAVSGDLKIGSYRAGRLRVRSVSGDVVIGIPPGVTLAVDAESLSGTVSSEIPLDEKPAVGANAPEALVSAQTVSGNVLIERAADSYVQV